jgi:hypothetical protein
MSKPKQHASDCAVHNTPALPVGPCDCGTDSSHLEDMGVVKAVADPHVPPGHCIVMLDGDVLYVGRIGPTMTSFITSDVFLILNPADHADGDDFMKKQIN